MATDNKYDRQERLWGSHGQKALMESRICVLGSTAVGTETLKNLVLPGCGNITIVDDAAVSEADLGNNFFVTEADVGSSRAETACKWLLEMNDDVSGSAVTDSVSELVASKPDFFKGFSLIIATQLGRADLSAVCKLAWEAGTPVVVVKSYGMLGYVRLASPLHAVYESKPDGQARRTDLRLSAPFPELLEVAAAHPWAGDDEASRKRRHDLPWPLILLEAAQRWKEQNDGAAPKGMSGKAKFRQLIQSMADTSSEDEDANENIEQAKENAGKAFEQPDMYDLKRVLEAMPAAFAQADGAPTEPFWYFIKAVGEFIDENGRPPLSGFLPDMTAATSIFVQLQGAYKARANADAAVLRQRTNDLLLEAGLSSAAVSDGQFRTWCKSSQFVDVIQFRSVQDELEAPCPALSSLQESLASGSEPEHLPLKWYIMLRAADTFHASTGRWPGVDDDKLEADAQLLAAVAKDECAAIGLSETHTWYDAEYTEHSKPLLTQDHATETARYGAAELHTVSAILGGIASQEAVKLITHQFVPVNNTFVYNGINGTTAALAV